MNKINCDNCDKNILFISYTKVGHQFSTNKVNKSPLIVNSRHEKDHKILRREIQSLDSDRHKMWCGSNV